MELSTSLLEATLPTRYEAEFFVKRVYEDYPSRGYNTGCKIFKRDGSWEVRVTRWKSCS